MTRLVFTLLICTFLFTTLSAQEKMRVIHCTAISQSASVTNVWVDKDNKKWVGTTNGLYKIHSADNASKVPLSSDMWSLLLQPGGNQHLVFSQQQLFIDNDTTPSRIPLTDDNQVSTAYYVKQSKQLWIGTTSKGVYCFQVAGDGVALAFHWDDSNSKLKSNYINSLFYDRYDRMWIGTKSGVLQGVKGKYKLYEKDANVKAITAIGPDVWIMSEDVLWMAGPKNRWIPGDFDLSLSQGTIRDIRFDSDARLWIASDIMTRYNVQDDIVEKFGRAEGFTSRNVKYIATDQDNALWVGTSDKGLYLIEKESTMTVTSEVVKPLTCDGNQSDAELKLKIIGGTAPYTYRWDKGLQGDQPKGLAAGLYTVTVTDSTGLQKIISARVSDTKPKAKVLVEQKASSEKRKDAIASLTGSGGKPDYTYVWSNGETGTSTKSLGSGKQEVTITDANGCTGVTYFDVEFGTEPEIPPLVVGIDKSGKNVCFDDQKVSLKVNVSGGQKPYKYAWSNSALRGAKLKKLSAGSYTLTVSDAAGNVSEQTVEVTGSSKLIINAAEAEPATKENTRDGIAIAKVIGGTPPYTYAWDNGEETAKAVKLSNGTHKIRVIDDNNCDATSTISVGVKQIPSLSIETVSSGQIIRLEKLYFRADSSNIEAASVPTLNELKQFLNTNPRIVIEVGGHTNNIPEEAYCDRLSTARAKSVAKFLTSQGIEANRVTYKGYGKRKPIAPNSTASGRKRNQRVEVKIVSVDG